MDKEDTSRSQDLDQDELIQLQGSSLKSLTIAIFKRIVPSSKKPQLYSLLITLHFLMQISYFYISSRSLWNNSGVFLAFEKVAKYYNIDEFVRKLEFSYYLAAVLTIGGISTLGALSYVYLIFSIKKGGKDTETVLVVFKTIGIIVGILFLQPVIYIMLGVLDCQNGTMTTYPTIDCYIGEHLFMAIGAFSTIFFALLLGGLFSFMMFEPLRYKGAPMNSFSPDWMVLFFVYRVAAIITERTLNGKDFYLLNTIIFLIISYLLYYITKHNDSFHNSKTSLMWNTMLLINLWTYLALTITMIASRESIDLPLYWIIGSVLFIIYSICTPSIRMLAFHKHLDYIDSVDDYIDHLERLVEIVRDQSIENNKIILKGYLQNHKKGCIDPFCPLRNSRKRNSTETELNSYEEYTTKKYGTVSNYINHTFKRALKTFQYSSKFRIKYAYYLFEELNSYSLALEQLKEASRNHSLWITDQLKVERLEVEIHNKMTGDNIGQRKNKMELLDEKEWSNKLMSTFEKLSYLFIDFWSNLNSNSPGILSN